MAKLKFSNAIKFIDSHSLINLKCMKQGTKVALAVIITAIVIGGGVYYWQNSQISFPKNNEVGQSTQKSYIFEKYEISLAYDQNWTVKKGYNKEGIIIEAPDQQGGKGTLVSFHPDLNDSDIGMGYKTISEKKYTNPNGVTFNINFMEEDPAFPRETSEKVNPDFAYIMFTLDTLPGIHVFHYYKDVNPNGEQQFWEMANSFKKT